jgi:hypothetical protein
MRDDHSEDYIEQGKIEKLLGDAGFDPSKENHRVGSGDFTDR